MGRLQRIHRTEKGHAVIIQPFEDTDRGWVSLADWKGRTNQKWFKHPDEIPEAVEELLKRKKEAE